MEIKDQDIYVMQLMQYFIAKKEYQMVLVQNQKNDVWLANPNTDVYPIIRLSSQGLETLTYDSDYIKEVYQAIAKQIHSVKPLLMIQTNGEKHITTKQMELVSMLPGSQVPNTLKSVFPDIEQVMRTPIDAQQEMMKIGDSIKQVQTDRQRKFLKKLRKPSKSFLLIAAFSLISFLVSFYFTANTGDLFEGILLSGAYYKMSVMVGMEYWRILTAPFAHYSLFQLIFSLYVLFLLTKAVETQYPKRVLPIFLIASYSGLLLAFVGAGNDLASGLIPGILGLFGAYSFELIAKGQLKNPLLKRAYLQMTLLLLILIMVPGISLIGLIGGLVSGVIAAMFLSDLDAMKQMRVHLFISMFLLLGGIGWYHMNYNQVVAPINQELDQSAVEAYRSIGLEDYANHLEALFEAYYKEEGK